MRALSLNPMQELGAHDRAIKIHTALVQWLRTVTSEKCKKARVNQDYSKLIGGRFRRNPSSSSAHISASGKTLRNQHSLRQNRAHNSEERKEFPINE